MALAKLPSLALQGIEGVKVNVEVDVSDGLPSYTVVGLADKAVEESRERIRSALRHSGFKFPLRRITVNLTPSQMKKSGVHFDLPIALGILLADEQIKPTERLNEGLFVGGLSLDGQLQDINGALIISEWAARKNFKALVLPEKNEREAALISGVKRVALANLNQVIEYLKGKYQVQSQEFSRSESQGEFESDYLQIQGQLKAKRAALIAACGNHNILLEGPPGAGKTLIAKGIRALLPPMTDEELIEVVKVHSIVNTQERDKLIDGIYRPFRAPHHSASAVAVTGGGAIPRPGEISLSHRGVLFLDELPEFNRRVIEALRQPLEEGIINVSRAEQSVSYPARFLLVATMNPCPCGWLRSNQKECLCLASQVHQYRKKISGPILDRMDIYLFVAPVKLEELKNPKSNYEELRQARETVKQVRQLSLARQGKLNNHLQAREISYVCQMTTEAEALLDKAAEKFVITGRGYHKLLKVARTIADIASHSQIEESDISEAISYRFPDKELV